MRRLRCPRTRAARRHHRSVVARGPGLPANRCHERRDRGHQPDRQDRRTHRQRLPQPRQPTPPSTVRLHPVPPPGNRLLRVTSPSSSKSPLNRQRQPFRDQVGQATPLGQRDHRRQPRARHQIRIIERCRDQLRTVRNSHPADAPSGQSNLTVASHILPIQQDIRGLRHAKPPYRNGGSRLRGGESDVLPTPQRHPWSARRWYWFQRRPRTVALSLEVSRGATPTLTLRHTLAVPSIPPLVDHMKTLAHQTWDKVVVGDAAGLRFREDSVRTTTCSNNPDWGNNEQKITRNHLASRYARLHGRCCGPRRPHPLPYETPRVSIRAVPENNLKAATQFGACG